MGNPLDRHRANLAAQAPMQCMDCSACSALPTSTLPDRWHHARLARQAPGHQMG